MRNRQLWSFLVIHLPLTLILFSPLSAEESVQQPTPAANTLEADQLRDLASRLLKDVAQFGCGKDSCKILVSDFSLADGKLCAYGIQLADQLSSEISELQKGFQIPDRRDVHQLLEIAPLPEKSIHDVGVARWVGELFDADTLVMGKIRKDKGNEIQVSVQLVDVATGRVGPAAETVILDSTADLSVLRRPTKLPSGRVHLNGVDLYSAGKDPLLIPTCFYMPNPTYTDEARAEKFSGVVVVLAVVRADGKVGNLLVLRTPGLGLTESTLQKMREWRCKPARVDGKSVSAIVTFEVNFQYK